MKMTDEEWSQKLEKIRELRAMLVAQNLNLTGDKVRLAKNNARISVLNELEYAHINKNIESVDHANKKLQALNDKSPVHKKQTEETMTLPPSTMIMLENYVQDGRAEDYEWPKKYIIAAQQEVEKDIKKLKTLETKLTTELTKDPQSKLLKQQLGAVVELLGAYKNDNNYEAILKAQKKVQEVEKAMTKPGVWQRLYDNFLETARDFIEIPEQNEWPDKSKSSELERWDNEFRSKGRHHENEAVVLSETQTQTVVPPSAEQAKTPVSPSEEQSQVLATSPAQSAAISPEPVAVLQQEAEQSVAAAKVIALHGKKLFEECLQHAVDSDSTLENLKESFEATIRKTINKNRSFGRDEIDAIEQSTNLPHPLRNTQTLMKPQLDLTKLNQIIDHASKKLAEERTHSKVDSVTKAKDGRWMINVPGRVYDTLSSMFHSIGKLIGVSQPTAAELFVQAAKESERMAAEVIKQQAKTNRVHAKHGHSWSLASLKDQGMESNVEAKTVHADKKRAALNKSFKEAENARSASVVNAPEITSLIQDAFQRSEAGQEVNLQVRRKPLTKISEVENRDNALESFKQLEENIDNKLNTKLLELRTQMGLEKREESGLEAKLQEQREFLKTNEKGEYHNKDEAQRSVAQIESLKLILSKESLSAEDIGQLSSLLLSKDVPIQEQAKATAKTLLKLASTKAELAETRNVIFPDSLQISNTELKGKPDMDRVADVMKRLNRVLSKDENFKAFQDQMREIAPSKDSWRGKILQQVGLRDKNITKGF